MSKKAPRVKDPGAIPKLKAFYQVMLERFVSLELTFEQDGKNLFILMTEPSGRTWLHWWVWCETGWYLYRLNVTWKDEDD